MDFLVSKKKKKKNHFECRNYTKKRKVTFPEHDTN